MAGLNKACIIGRLGQNPEIKTAQSGISICSFSVATSEEWTDKQTGEKQERTEWHKVTAFNKLADICGKYLTKGRQCYVEGKLQTSSYEKDGQTHYTTKVIADNVIFLGDVNSKGEPVTQNQQQGGYSPKPAPAPVSNNPYRQPATKNHGGYEQEDDNIPF